MSIYIKCLVNTSLFSDEIPESSNVRIHAGVQRFSAANSPGYNTDQISSSNQRTARVTLASVLSSATYSSADHVLCDSTVRGIRRITFGSGHNIHSHRLKLSWKWWWSGREGSPAAHHWSSTGSRFSAGESNWLNCSSVFEGDRYLSEESLISYLRVPWECYILARVLFITANQWMVGTLKGVNLPTYSSVYFTHMQMTSCLLNLYRQLIFNRSERFLRS
jgi:hypothetical protein